MLQMPCLRKTDSHRALSARCWWAAIALVWHASVGAAPDSAAPAPALEALTQQAIQWAAHQPSFKGRSVHVAPLDSRLTVQNCQQTLQFDQPFPGQPSVRVRCAQPQWQLFITLNNGSEASAVNGRASLGPSVQKVLISQELLKRGTLLTASMFKATEMQTPGAESQLISDPKSLVNMELIRDLAPNTPLRTFDLKTAVLVKRGQEVQVTAGEGQGFSITMRAEAQQDGGLGEQIRLKNTESGRSLTATITGPNTARLK